jgi:DNA repair protein RecO (recombination protein O)
VLRLQARLWLPDSQVGYFSSQNMNTTTRVQLVPGFVLHQRPYRESSLLVETFTATHGRVGLVARGVRSSRSRQRSELQLFRPLLLSWNSRGDLGTLTSVEADGTASKLAGRSLFSAFYLNELLVRLVARQDPHPGLFERYRNDLRALNEGVDIEPVLRKFEKTLLEETGYGLLLDYEAEQGTRIQADRYYDYHLQSGPVEVEGPDAQGFIFQGASLLAIARDQLDESQVRLDAKRLMRSALNLYLGGKPLKSRELFRTIKK